MMWTRFMDMHSGGHSKEQWEYIFIEAPEDEAKIIFYNRFGHNPDRVTCTCCGSDYSISSEKDLAQLTAFDRNLPSISSGGDAITLAAYLKQPNVHVIRANEIKAAERVGEVPEQGYVWI